MLSSFARDAKDYWTPYQGFFSRANRVHSTSYSGRISNCAGAVSANFQSNFNWPEGRCATFAFARYLQITGTSHLQPGIECFERALLSSNRFLSSLASRVILPPTPVRRPPPRSEER